jgi:hypothetical protein
VSPSKKSRMFRPLDVAYLGRCDLYVSCMSHPWPMCPDHGPQRVTWTLRKAYGHLAYPKLTRNNIYVYGNECPASLLLYSPTRLIPVLGQSVPKGQDTPVRDVLSKGRRVEGTSRLFVRGHIGQGWNNIAPKEGFAYPGSSVTLSFPSYKNLIALFYQPCGKTTIHWFEKSHRKLILLWKIVIVHTFRIGCFGPSKVKDKLSI